MPALIASIGPWLVLLIGIVAIPASGKAAEEGGLRATAILAYYVMVVVALASIRLLPAARSFDPDMAKTVLAESKWRRVVFAATVIGVVGLAALAYDRVVVQGIDYSRGLANARVQWAAQGEERQGVSSAFSAVGNLGSHFLFVSVACVLFAWERCRVWARAFALVMGLAGCVTLGALNGGRSHLLLLMAVVLAVATLRRVYLVGSPLPWSSGRSLLVMLTLAALFLSYVVYVVRERAEMVGVPFSSYSEITVDWLGGEVTTNYWKIESLPGGIRDVAFLAVSALGYLVHGVWSTEWIVTTDERPGMVLFAMARSILQKLQLLGASQPYLLHGKYLPLPAAIYYDFGVMGVGIGAWAHGLLLGAVGYRRQGQDPSVVWFGLSVGVLVVTLWAPILFAGDTYGFPFMMLAFITIDALARRKSRRRGFRG